MLSSSSTTTTLQDLERWFYQSSSVVTTTTTTSSSQVSPKQQQEALERLQEWINRAQTSESHRSALALICFQLVVVTNNNNNNNNNNGTSTLDGVRFAALSTLARLPSSAGERRELRNFFLSPQNNNDPVSLSFSWRNKVALILVRHLFWDAGTPLWSTWIQDLLTLSDNNPSLFLKTTETFLEEFWLVRNNSDDGYNYSTNATHSSSTHPETANFINNNDNLMIVISKESRKRIKYLLFGYDIQASYTASTAESSATTTLPITPTPLEQIFAATLYWLRLSLLSLSSNNLNNNPEESTPPNQPKEQASERLTVSALDTVRAFFVFWNVTKSTPTGRSAADAATELLLTCLRSTTAVQLASLQAWNEWIAAFGVLDDHTTNNNNNNQEWNMKDDDDLDDADNTMEETTTTTTTIRKQNDHHCLDKLSALLERLHQYDLLPYTGESRADIHVVIQVAQLISTIGISTLPSIWSSNSTIGDDEQQQQQQQQQQQTLFQNKILDLFFRAFNYDDIDVSGAVLPLAHRLAQRIQLEQQQLPDGGLSLLPHFPQILNILYRQLKYPVDYSYNNQHNHSNNDNPGGSINDDYDDDTVAAEEEQFRVELCKFYVQLVRANPRVCLQLIGEAWFAATASSWSTSDLEATLRLLHAYAEGLRPSPGVNTALHNPDFCQLLLAIHRSDLPVALVSAHHNSRQLQSTEVLCWYYEVSVRYCAFFKQRDEDDNNNNNDRPGLLGRLLESMTGERGLRHPYSAKVRTRCAYLFLRLVRAVTTLLQPLVETAVLAISQWLSQRELTFLRPDDSLYLLEAVGLLLGSGPTNALSPLEQQRYLTLVMTTHVHSIQSVLSALWSHRNSRNGRGHYNAAAAAAEEDENYGQSLSYSIAAMAYLSKGFTENNNKKTLPPLEVQQVWVETTTLAQEVIIACPQSEAVRNRVMVFLQRMIQSIGSKVLPFMPVFFGPLIEHCNGEDVLFVAQLFNQLCIKFQADAVPAIDAALYPFLQKCQSLAGQIWNAATDDSWPAAQSTKPTVAVPPHVYTEQLSIQKLAFTVLHHIVMHRATAVLISTTNANHLENIFRAVQDGTIRATDPVVQRTCLKFFRQLLEQWQPQNQQQNGDSARNNDNDEHQYYRVLWTFCVQCVWPNAWQSFLTSRDTIFRDAQRVRNVTELAMILLAVFYYSPATDDETATTSARSSLSNVLSATTTSPQWPAGALACLNTAAAATTAEVKRMEQCLIQALKHRQGT